ncbi:MAG: MopE-related protein [Phycisphaerales bacterium]
MLVQQTSGGTGSNWVGIQLPCTGPNAFLFFGKPFSESTWGIDGATTHKVSAVSSSTLAFLVMRVDFKAGPDDVYMWVNPPLGSEPSIATANVSALAYGDFKGITSVKVQIGTNGGAITGTLDEVRLGTTYEYVAPTNLSGDCDMDGIPNLLESDPYCCWCLCPMDQFCCAVQWDAICAALAAQICDRDCNGNGQLDTADIYFGVSADCNKNCIPDECEFIQPICDVGDTPEGEPCAAGSADTVNGGCNSTPPVFGSIGCCESICGTVWAAGDARDTDWYQFVLNSQSTVTITALTNFNYVLGIVATTNGNPVSCGEHLVLNPGVTASAYSSPPVTTTLAPGTYWIFIAPDAFDGYQCCGCTSSYKLTLECPPQSPPAGVLATPSTICAGASSTLTGTVGAHETLVWHTGSCNGPIAGTGSPLVVSPASTTAYYAAATNCAGASSCVPVTVTVNQLPSTPSPAATPSTICAGQSSTLSVTPVAGTTFAWFTGSCGGTSAGNGPSIAVNPATTTTYYVQATNSCGSSACGTVTVTVNQPLTWYQDQDNDGYGDPNSTTTACTPPPGFVSNNGDCDDTNGAINPAAPEIACNLLDDNCNGLTDEPATTCMLIPTTGGMTGYNFHTKGLGSASYYAWMITDGNLSSQNPYGVVLFQNLNVQSPAVNSSAKDVADQLQTSIYNAALAAMCDVKIGSISSCSCCQVLFNPPYPPGTIPPVGEIASAKPVAGTTDEATFTIRLRLPSWKLWVWTLPDPPNPPCTILPTCLPSSCLTGCPCDVMPMPAPACEFNPTIQQIPFAGFDCNDNGDDDGIDIFVGVSLDLNGDGIPDECDSCVGDLNGDGVVDGADLGLLLGSWGTGGGPGGGDLNNDGLVDGADLGLLLGGWGPCSGAPSTLLAYEGFEYTPEGDTLSSYSGSGSGWDGDWTGEWRVLGPGLGYTDTAGNALRVHGSRIDGSAARSVRSLHLADGPLGSTPATLWISMLAQQTSDDPTSTWMGVSLPSSGRHPYLFFGKPDGKSPWGIDNGTLAEIRLSATPSTQVAFIVIRIDFKEGLDDVHMWVNPSLAGEPSVDSAEIAAVGFGDFTGITTVAVDIGTAKGEIAGAIDEIRLGSTYGAVAPISAIGGDQSPHSRVK